MKNKSNNRKNNAPAPKAGEPKENKASLHSADEKALTREEKKKLEECEADVKEFDESIKKQEKSAEVTDEETRSKFQKMVEAMRLIRDKKLHRATHATFEGYVFQTFDWSRAHANRMADAGAVIMELSPRGDIADKLDTEAHCRPFFSLLKHPQKMDELADVVARWAAFGGGEITPSLIRAAKLFAFPPKPSDTGSKTEKLIVDVEELIVTAEKEMRGNNLKEKSKVFKKLMAELKKLLTPRTTGIGWTQKTWNPIVGCSRKSEACDNCYAARECATRKAYLYASLTSAIKNGGYAFNGKVHLLPERLSVPLDDTKPAKFFVCSLSDIFHENVPDDFISAVFDVMEKAEWHEFQVLTKRPERMASFTQERYKERPPPKNIWLGTTAENQERFDERIGHLENALGDIKWLSVEPMLGPVVLGKHAQNIGWVVVGGEKIHSSKLKPRETQKEWVVALRDECKKADIPFFFKQWPNALDENGKRMKKGSIATLDGEVHQCWPVGDAGEDIVDDESAKE